MSKDNLVFPKCEGSFYSEHTRSRRKYSYKFTFREQGTKFRLSVEYNVDGDKQVFDVDAYDGDVIEVKDESVVLKLTREGTGRSIHSDSEITWEDRDGPISETGFYDGNTLYSPEEWYHGKSRMKKQ